MANRTSLHKESGMPGKKSAKKPSKLKNLKSKKKSAVDAANVKGGRMKLRVP